MTLFKSTNTAVIEQCSYFVSSYHLRVQLQRRFEKCSANAADDDNVILTLNDY